MSQLTKVLHWETRAFNAFLRDEAKQPFQWGVRDCCLFPADAIKAITGVDIASDFRGKYTDETSAFALIKSVTGGTTVADAAAYCATKYGMTENTHPLMAKRGDLVVIQNGSNLIAGVVHLNGREVVTTGPDGLVVLPITKVVRSWSV